MDRLKFSCFGRGSPANGSLHETVGCTNACEQSYLSLLRKLIEYLLKLSACPSSAFRVECRQGRDMPSLDLDHFLAQEFTHIVVGGGTAGLVVAVRLSEDPSIRVGVLEAGSAGFNDPRITVPGRFGEILGSELDWQFETTKQPGLDGRSLPFPRGKVLGGTSALNFMTWNRGCREDYDAWEKLGNKGWGWDALL